MLQVRNPETRVTQCHDFDSEAEYQAYIAKETEWLTECTMKGCEVTKHEFPTAKARFMFFVNGAVKDIKYLQEHCNHKVDLLDLKRIYS